LRRRQFLGAAGVALATLSIGGCAIPERSDEDAGLLGPALESFTASGRLAIRQSERSDHLQFDWQHSPHQDVVLLLGPLGQGLAEIVRDAAGARMTRPNATPVAAPNIAILAQEVFGIPLPLQELGDWLRGARGLSGDQDGWRIVITQTTPYRQNRLPRRVEVSQGDVKLTLIVDTWSDGN
jgi:outer membrane lipoprotein LolB